MQTITLTVNERMHLNSSILAFGNDGNRNAAVFVIDHPLGLDAMTCRAEIENGGHKAFIPVADRQFTLSSISAGMFKIQLVYADENGVVVTKTDILAAIVGKSINAAEEAIAALPDGIAEMQGKSYTGSDIDPDTGDLVFMNLQGQEVGRVALPAGGETGGGYPIDNHTLKVIEGKLQVNTTNEAAQDNTLPITSAGVDVIVGNINILLGTI